LCIYIIFIKMSFADQMGRGNSNPQPLTRGAYEPQRSQSPNYGNNYSSSSSNSTFGRGYGASSNDYDQNVKIVTENIRQLSVNITQIKSLSDALGTSKDSLENREQLRHLIDSTRVISSDTAQSMKSLHDTRSSGPQEDKTRKFQQQKLVKDFQIILQRFQEISKIAAEKERNTPLPQKSQKSQNAYASYDDEPVDYEKQGLIEAQRTQQLQLDNDRQFMDSLIADREQGIREIEKAVVEVNEIFRDLSNLVHEQGAMIDNIESNIEESVVKTSEGVEELRKANDYQKSSRNKMCCLALIILIIAAIIVVVVYFVLAKK